MQALKKEIIIDGIIYIPKIETKTETKKVGFQIKNRFTWSVIYESEKTTCREAVIEYCNIAQKNNTRANLTGANLKGVDLKGANLTRVDLTGVDLTDADLTGCLFYFWNWNRNFEALCRAIKTIKHIDGKFEDFQS